MKELAVNASKIITHTEHKKRAIPHGKLRKWEKGNVVVGKSDDAKPGEPPPSSRCLADPHATTQKKTTTTF